ncbi:nickel-dependent hydrogenase large subunit [Rhodoferax sp.]|uniref:nickel-dependent hydrogenase large subunit n=1 Tax=Rhodoferax sp. TaxID=50421 RepID=UPI0028506E1A|nr:nickel-dependent hydrogenase large subunit [Rhodoferax sp.]MDR3369196.1 nickel-dependent hydrogenase large subunit [Rhodoferax sp.]
MSASMDLAGSYTLRPGMLHSIEGHRPVMGNGALGRLLRGQQGEAVDRMLGQVFTLCSHAHRRTARLALNAAHRRPDKHLPVDAPVLLWLETARDHLRSMALDWPRRQPESSIKSDLLAWLRDCPLSMNYTTSQSTPDQAWQALTQLRHWLEKHLLGQPVGSWLIHHREPDALAQWCRSHAPNVSPAQSLHTWHERAHPIKPALRSLDVLHADPARQTAALQSVANALASNNNFAQHPTWLGQCAETGPWTRLRHQKKPHTTVTAWTRLSARWTELMEIAAVQPHAPAHHTPDLLSSGALHLDEDQAIAWCEMARGLLLHWVQLDDHGRVADYRVVAPTEWNFHPQGALAQALTTLAPHDAPSALALAAAFDACVECKVTTQAPTENKHA